MDNSKKDLTNNDKRTRINRIKKAIVIVTISLIVIPIILCIILTARVCSLENKLDDLIAKKDAGEIVYVVDNDGNIHLKDTSELPKKEETTDNKTVENNSENESDKLETSDNQEATSEIPEETTLSEQELLELQSKPGYGKIICLTFDDGPSENTQKIIDVLDRYNIKATFFVVAKTDPESLERYKLIVESGNTIALHSYTHDYSQIYENIEAYIDDVTKIHDLVYEATGVDTKLYRFPGGSANSLRKMDVHECIDYLNSQGYKYFDWNITSGDASPTLQTKEQIMQNIKNTLYNVNTGIILMHDAEYKPTTLEVLPELIEFLQSEGFELKAIDNSTPTVQQIKNETED